MSVLAHAAVDPAASTPPPDETAKRSWTAYLLLLPGALWLGVFFVLPLVQLATVSLQSRYPGFPGYYYRDVNFDNYVAALTDWDLKIEVLVAAIWIALSKVERYAACAGDGPTTAEFQCLFAAQYPNIVGSLLPDGILYE